jgi:hypothetical protein
MILLWLLSTTPLQRVWTVVRRAVWLCSQGKYCSPQSRLAVTKVRPQYTCPYVARLPPGSSSAVPDARMRAGWRIQQDPTQPMGTLVETRLWTSDGKCNGVRYHRGDNMLTWHVIRDASLSSYDILANPVYNAAAAAIHRAAERVRASLGVLCASGCFLSLPFVCSGKRCNQSVRIPSYDNKQTRTGNSMGGNTKLRAESSVPHNAHFLPTCMLYWRMRWPRSSSSTKRIKVK